MPEDLFDPTAERPYLGDANYYRLGYQLSAQLMHREASEEKRSVLYESASDILYGERRPGEAYSSAARRQAEVVQDEAEAVVAWFAERRNTRRWLFFRDSPSPTEQRLDRFLRRTVIPCLTIVIAASLRPDEPELAEARIGPMRRRAGISRDSEQKEDGLSYRALYNLACYEASGTGEDGREAAFRYLAAALDGAPGGRRRELGRWASEDPSLRPMREMSAFRELLEPYLAKVRRR